MKKFFSLLKATTKGDMSVFKIKGNRKNKISNILLIGLLSLLMMIMSYSYSDIIGSKLNELGLTYILLTLFSLAIVVLNILETIYKSQGIIFDAKDNNLLFSLPVKKSYILSVRIIKLVLFDYIFEILFLVPCFVRYAQFVNPNVSYYFISLLFLILLPLIPLVIGCIFGYLIKLISSMFRNKKFVQTIISLVMFFLIYALYFNMDKLLVDIVKTATSLNELISKIYLPIGLYIELIQKFNFIKLIELLLISIVPFILFIYLFQFKYDSIINNSKEEGKKNKKKVEIKTNSILKSLTLKEVKTYFSIPAYVINTFIGPLLTLGFSIFTAIKYDSVINNLSSPESGFDMNQILSNLPLIVIVFIMGMTAMTSITSCSISLEGKKISLIKSLPINPYDLFLSKMLTSDMLIIPFMLISAVILIIRLKIYNYYILFILFICLVFPHLIAEIGLLVNLKFPKLNYNSEVEVVKQSAAVLISIMIGLIVCFIPTFTFFYVAAVLGNLLTLVLYGLIIIVLIIILDKLIKTYGSRRYSEL